VTFKAVAGQTPHLTNIDLGTLMYLDSSGNRLKLAIGNGQPAGNANAYLRFEGLTIDDGVSIEGSRYVQVVNCTVNRIGALNDSVENIEKKIGIQTFYGAAATSHIPDYSNADLPLALEKHVRTKTALDFRRQTRQRQSESPRDQ
jgi:hypothetical protein